MKKFKFKRGREFRLELRNIKNAIEFYNKSVEHGFIGNGGEKIYNFDIRSIKIINMFDISNLFEFGFIEFKNIIQVRESRKYKFFGTPF